MSSVHNSVETVNAAATAIVTAESRIQPSAVQKRGFGRSCLSIYSCFGAHKQANKIGHAGVQSESSISDNRNHYSSISSSSATIPFIAPPSSPASFLQSDLPSVSLSVQARFSPDGPESIFAIGPYAHETQLVSPPVFSTFTTEPSTASFTPPPEPVQMTNPSSAEVPFAQLPLSQYEFRPYGNPGGPGSERRAVLEFRMGEAPKFLGYENYKWESRAGSGSLTPNEWGSGALTPIAPKVLPDNLAGQRVSFELFGEEIPTCVVRTTSLRNEKEEAIADGPDKKEDSFRENLNGERSSEEEPHKKHRTISLGSSKDFNFTNGTNEGVKKELGPQSSWSFFPMLQSGRS